MPIFLIIISVLPLDIEIIRKNQNTLLLATLLVTIFIWPIPLGYIITEYEKQSYQRWKLQGGKELESIIDEKIHLTNVRPDEIFNRSLSWLKKQKIRVRIEIKPLRIFAVYSDYVDRLSRDYTESDKEIEILIRKEDDGVQLRILMDSPGRKGPWRTHHQELKNHWKSLVEDFYRHIGVNVDTELLSNLYEHSTLKNLINFHKKEEKSYIFGGITIIIIFIFLGIISNIKSLFWGIVLAFLLFWNANYQRKKMNEYQSKLNLLYKNKGQN